MILNEKEEKYISRLEKNVQTMYINYFAIVFLFCVAVTGLIIGIKDNRQDALFGAIFFAYAGLSLLLMTYLIKKHYNLIKKMKDFIDDSEKAEK